MLDDYRYVSVYIYTYDTVYVNIIFTYLYQPQFVSGMDRQPATGSGTQTAQLSRGN
jgi:hypothetical protein